MRHQWAIGLVATALLCGGGCTSPGDTTQQTSMQDSCISAARIRNQEIVSNQEIKFTLAGGEVWLNRLPRACPGLKSIGGFAWDASNSICANKQIIYVEGMPCLLGDFTRVAAESQD